MTVRLQARMSFAAFVPRRNWLARHLVLARRVDTPRFTRIDVIPARKVVHSFRLTGLADVDAEFRGWLARGLPGRRLAAAATRRPVSSPAPAHGTVRQ